MHRDLRSEDTVWRRGSSSNRLLPLETLASRHYAKKERLCGQSATGDTLVPTLTFSKRRKKLAVSRLSSIEAARRDQRSLPQSMRNRTELCVRLFSCSIAVTGQLIANTHTEKGLIVLGLC